MAEGTGKPLRFKLAFTWGGLVLALLGGVVAATGELATGLLLMVVGVLGFLFAKRRTREAMWQ
jgi:hypothetical protein